MEVWLLVGVVALVLGIGIYFSIPFFKKLKAGQKDDAKKEAKRVSKLEKKEIKEEKKQQIENSKKQADLPVGTVVEAGEDFFEDPDTKVNYENFDLGGLFEDTIKKQPLENDFFEEDDATFSNNVDEMFENYFENNVPPSQRNVNSMNLDEINTDDEEINQFLQELNNFNGENDLSEDFKNLSPEMKALMISNFLDRKDI